MVAYMRAMVKQYPTIAQLFTVGDKTYEGRDIFMMKIGNAIGRQDKRVVWIDAGIHSREWASQHVALYIINKLLTEYATNPTIKAYVDTLNFYIVPVLNPDGYAFSQSSTNPRVRLWRKNRNLEGGRRAGDCFGVDLNRNFDFHWGEAGSSTNPCSEVYQGASAFSEVESRAVRDMLQSTELRGKVDAFITLHTYSQIWMHPYGHKLHSYPANKGELERVANEATSKLKQRFKTSYKVGSGADTLYEASGGSDDWTKATLDVKFVYLLELRPDEDQWDGFILQESALLPTSIETWDGIGVVIDEVLKAQGVTPPTTTPPPGTVSR